MQTGMGNSVYSVLNNPRRCDLEVLQILFDADPEDANSDSDGDNPIRDIAGKILWYGR